MLTKCDSVWEEKLVDNVSWNHTNEGKLKSISTTILSGIEWHTSLTAEQNVDISY